jgi:serine/threonine protein kinase
MFFNGPVQWSTHWYVDVPCTAKSFLSLIDQIKKSNYIVPFDLDYNLQDLILKLMNVDPRKRMIFDEVLEHPWIKNHRPTISFPFAKSISNSQPILNAVPLVQAINVMHQKPLSRNDLLCEANPNPNSSGSVSEKYLILGID